MASRRLSRREAFFDDVPIYSTMYRRFQDLPIDCWMQTGLAGGERVSLCMRGEPEAIAVILEAIAELAAEDPPTRRTVTLRSSKRRKSCDVIQLRYSVESESLRQLFIRREQRKAILEFTPAGLEPIREAIAGWHAGGEDFCIAPSGQDDRKRQLGPRDRESLDLWFWGTMWP